MIKSFISKSAGGKSLCMLMEAAAQKNKTVAYITLEMNSKDILNRLDSIKPKTKSFNVIEPASNKNLNQWLIKKLQQLSDEVDIICVDAIDLVPNLESLKKLNEACFGGFMTQCDEFWVCRSTYRKVGTADNYLSDLNSVKSFEVEDLLKVKQVCQRKENPLLPGTYFIESVDLETKEVKIYNLANIFKNKQTW